MNKILCKKCAKTLDESEFYVRNGKILRPCKPCKKSYYLAWVNKNPGYHDAWRTKKDKDPDKVATSVE